MQNVSDRLLELDTEPTKDATLGLLSDKALQKVTQDKMQQLYKHELNRMGLKDFCARYYPESAFNYSRFEEMEERKDFGTKISSKDTIGLFITISPTPGTCSAVGLIEIATKKYLKESQVFTEAHFVIEQGSTTSDSNMGYHPHLHILLKLNKESPSGERSRAFKQIKNHWRSLSDQKHAVDIKPVSLNTWPKKMKYLNGQKDEDKLVQVGVDKLWRSQNRYKDIYSYPS